MALELTATPMSSHVMRIGYDEETQTLQVHYAPTVKNPGGLVVEYLGVEPDTADRVIPGRHPGIKVLSVGSALHSFVRGQYETRG